MFIGSFNGQKKEIVIHRFDKIIISAQTNRLYRGGNVVNGCENDEFGMGTVRSCGFQNLQTIDFRHEQIEKHYIEIRFFNFGNGIPAVITDIHVPDAPPFEQTLHRIQGDFFIIDNQDSHNLCLPISRIIFCNCNMLKGFLRR